MKLSHHRAGAVALTAAFALTLTACGSDDPVGGAQNGATADAAAASSLSGELNGAGASSIESAMEAWRAGFQNENPDVTVNYDPVGSGGGRTQFLEGGVLFAGTDSALSEDELEQSIERCAGATAIDLPVYVSPIAVTFNLDGIDSLNLSAATVAAIFDGKITQWDAPEIAAENPGVTLPALAITTVHRSDDSGTTKNFTDYLSKAAGGAWSYEASGDWPIEGGQSAQGTSGLIQTVQSAQGTIGYADLSKVGALGTASIKVGDAWVAPSEAAAAAALDASPRDDSRDESDIVITLDRTTSAAGAYPLVLVSYGVACTAYETQEDAEMVKAFLTYVVSEQGQKASESAAGSAPISAALRTDVQAAIDSISAAS